MKKYIHYKKDCMNTKWIYGELLYQGVIIMKENNRLHNLDKKITRFSIRKYQGYGAASVAIIGFILMSHMQIVLIKIIVRMLTQ